MGYDRTQARFGSRVKLWCAIVLYGDPFSPNVLGILIWLGLERIVTIYVGNLSFQATEEDLWEVFAEYGEISRISLPTDRETGRKRGFAFIEMKEDSVEESVIAELDGAEWMGRELRVNKAKPRDNNRRSAPRASAG